jgi:hypothetical protein
MISQKKNITAKLDIRGRISDRNLLVLIFVGAVILRLFSAYYQGNEVTALPGTWDQLSYDGLAQRVVAGYGFNFADGHWPATRAGEPTAHWSYLYTLYLAAVYFIFGYQPLIARVIQALIAGVLQTWFTWRIGRRIFGPKVGLLAAAISAVYVYFFYYGGSLLTESLYFVGILWTLDVTLRIAEIDRQARESQGEQSHSSRWIWLELGLAIGVTVLLRQVFLLFVPILFLWIWWNSQDSATRSSSLSQLLNWPALRGLIVTTMVVVMLILPWTIRNYFAFDAFVPLNTNAGFAFFWGNHPIHGTNFTPILSESYRDLIPAELLSLNEGQLDQALLRKALNIIAADPQRFLLLSVSRVAEYFKFWPSSESGIVSNLSRVASFALFLPFMLYGLWRSMHLVRKPAYAGQQADLVLLYLFMLIYTAVHLASWTLIRYRLPVDAILILFAALGANDIVNRVVMRRGLVQQSPSFDG